MPAQLPIDRIIREVEDGLPTEARARIDRAQKGHDFFNFDGKRHMAEFMGDAETAFDYVKRPYRESGLTREVTEVLTEHLYSPGPSRQVDDAEAKAFLDRVYADNHIDAVMQRADQLSTLSDVACIQVDADEGRFEDAPITLRLWGADEFHVWEDPDDRRKAAAVVTIDRYDETTRYRLWTQDQVRTFTTKRGSGTSGGRVATLVDTEANRYGCTPFAFVHYELPVQTFWTPGIGDLIVSAEIRVNDRLSRLDQSISKHLNPVPIARNLPDGWQAIMGQPNLWIRLPNRAMVPDGSGGYAPAQQAELEYLSVRIDIAGAWEDARSYLNQVLEAARVPASAVRMEQTGVASGISLMVEQAPLLTRARRRRGAFGVYEADLARTILRCAGNHYGRPGLVAAAKSAPFNVGWPTPSVPVPTDDWFDLEMKKVGSGSKSLLMVVQEMGGMTRDQAIQYLEQVAKDQAELERIMPELMAPPDQNDQGNVELRAEDNRLRPIDQRMPKEKDAL